MVAKIALYTIFQGRLEKGSKWQKNPRLEKARARRTQGSKGSRLEKNRLDPALRNTQRSLPPWPWEWESSSLSQPLLRPVNKKEATSTFVEWSSLLPVNKTHLALPYS